MRIETLLTEIRDRQDERISKVEARLDGNGKPGLTEEVNSLKNWRSYIAGAVAVLTVLWLASVTIGAAFISRGPAKP